MRLYRALAPTLRRNGDPRSRILAACPFEPKFRAERNRLHTPAIHTHVQALAVPRQTVVGMPVEHERSVVSFVPYAHRVVTQNDPMAVQMDLGAKLTGLPAR